ncbi:MAG: rane protein [Holophagaceae bacterium]|nr:rane protein [Holophagaceae bacterium]
MGVLLLFLLVGCAAGWCLRGSQTSIRLVQRLTRYALWTLLGLMGGKLALNRELFSKDLGLFAWAVGSSLLLALAYFAAFGLLRLLGLGRSQRPQEVVEAPRTHSGSALAAVGINAGCVLLGCLVILLLPGGMARALPLGPAAEHLLQLLILLIGFDLGAELHRLDLRQLGLPILVAPFLNIAFSLGCGLLYARLRGLPAREGLLLYAGLGWYSLAPVLIAGQGLLILSVMAFIHNIFRELLAILTAPLAARLSPYLPIYLGGATTMDVMLPFVQRYAGRAYTLASFFSGLVCSLAVAPLVRLLLR